MYLKVYLLFILGIACLSVPIQSNAEARVYPLPNNNKLVKFVYENTDTFVVLLAPEFHTDIELAEDEIIEKPFMGESVRWDVAAHGNHFVVKPRVPDITTSLTLLSRKANGSIRVYHFELRAGPPAGMWYQHVSFEYPSDQKIEQAQAARQQRVIDVEKERVDMTRVASFDPSTLNYDYVITGDRDIAPDMVFDDGRFTWMRMRPGVTETPAIFALETKDGKNLSLTTSTLNGRYVVVQRTATEFMLRIGNRESSIVNNAIKSKDTGRWFPFWGN